MQERLSPHTRVLQRIKKLEPILSKNVFGTSPPSLLVGKKGYPDVFAGPLITPEKNGEAADVINSPSNWLDMSIDSIIDMCSSLVKVSNPINVKSANAIPTSFSSDDVHTNILSELQQCALSARAVDSEVLFEKPPRVELRFDNILMPMGPSGRAKRIEIVDNPVVPRKVDKVVYDIDIRAADAVVELYSHDIDHYYITRLLSAGLLGQKRTLVPSRWSITATEDLLGKWMINKIIDYPLIADFELYSGERLGNHFEILFIPRPYTFELVEVWMKKSIWAPEGAIVWDSEGCEKKRYSSLAGGYYSARMGVLDHLYQKKRQACVFIIREVRPDYWAPLGSWVVNQTVKEVLSGRPKKFEVFEDAIKDMETRLITPREEWLRPQMRVNQSIYQRGLFEF